MKREAQKALTQQTAKSGVSPSPSAADLRELRPIAELHWSDATIKALRTRLFDGFRADFEHDPSLWDATIHVIVHAIRTFGSEEKAHSWLTSLCGALGNQRPYDWLIRGKHDVVDEELDRIDHGIYV